MLGTCPGGIVRHNYFCKLFRRANEGVCNQILGLQQYKLFYIQQHLLDMCDKSLRAILKLSQVSMTLTIFDDLFIHWLDLISRSEMAGQVVSSTILIYGLFAQKSHSQYHHCHDYCPERTTYINARVLSMLVNLHRMMFKVPHLSIPGELLRIIPPSQRKHFHELCPGYIC